VAQRGSAVGAGAKFVAVGGREILKRRRGLATIELAQHVDVAAAVTDLSGAAGNRTRRKRTLTSVNAEFTTRNDVKRREVSCGYTERC
jgi:hypothetical protein